MRRERETTLERAADEGRAGARDNRWMDGSQTRGFVTDEIRVPLNSQHEALHAFQTSCSGELLAVPYATASRICKKGWTWAN